MKVLDFGISKIIDSDGATSLTGSSSTMGSPAYMSPEQVRSTKLVDARSDIWAMGVILYELLTGARPFEADSTGATYAAILERPLVPVRDLRPELPEGLELVIHRCLQRTVDLRYRSFAALASALAPYAPDGASAAERVRARLGADRPRHADAVTTVDTTEAPPPPERRIRWMMVVAASALAIGGGLMTLRASRPALAMHPTGEPTGEVAVPSVTSPPLPAPSQAPRLAASPPVASASDPSPRARPPAILPPARSTSVLPSADPTPPSSDDSVLHYRQ